MLRDEGIAWFAVAKSVFGHPLLQGPYCRLAAWLWLIANAAWKSHSVMTRGGLVHLERGEVLIGRDHLAVAWGWSSKKVRVFLEQLQSDDMIIIGQSRGHFANVARICNYERFQLAQSHVGPVSGEVNGQSVGSEGPHRTRDNKGKQEVSPTPKGDGSISAEVREAFDAYNATAERNSLAKATKLTTDRARKIKVRVADYGLDGWHRALAEIEGSAFLTGKTKEGFRADLGFMCKPERFAKLHEGGYRNAFGSASTPSLFTDADGVMHIRRYAP